MIRCPDCGEEKRIHEKPGLYMSLYTCEACGCEFRQCESDQVIGLYKQLDEKNDEITRTEKEIERVRKNCENEIGMMEENVAKLYRECWDVEERIEQIRREWREKLEVTRKS